MNTIDPTDSRSLDQAIMMGMPGLENPCVERIANTPDGVQPCYGCTLDCPYCTPAKEDTMDLYQHNHTEDDGTVSTNYYSVPEDDHSPIRSEDEARDAMAAMDYTETSRLLKSEGFAAVDIDAAINSLIESGIAFADEDELLLTEDEVGVVRDQLRS